MGVGCLYVFDCGLLFFADLVDFVLVLFGTVAAGAVWFGLGYGDFAIGAPPLIGQVGVACVFLL